MTRAAFSLLFLVLLFSCATSPRSYDRVSPRAPFVSERSTGGDWLHPSQAWPIRITSTPIPVSLEAGLPPYLLPRPAARIAALPLPLPVAEPPIQTLKALQWAPPAPKPVVRAQPAALRPLPVAPVAAPVPAASPKTTKPAATTPLVAPPKTASVPPVAPVTQPVVQLLPQDSASNADFAWQDMNIAAGEDLSLQFPKTNWLYLDSPAQQKVLGYVSSSRDKDGTGFLFRPMTPGQYILEFQRQDLSSQSTDVRHIRLRVAPAGTKTVNSTVLVPQSATGLSAETLEASRKLAAAGKTAEAVQRILQDYKIQDTRANLEIARLLESGQQGVEALDYLDKNLLTTGSDFTDSLDLGTKIALSNDTAIKLPGYAKLWMEGASPPSETLYLQVMEALRKQKLTALGRDWVKLYDTWYRNPQARDQYLFQLGTLLEEPGELQNIKEAFKAYTQIIEKYPLSPWWKAAGDKAAALNRHFLQAR